MGRARRNFARLFAFVIALFSCIPLANAKNTPETVRDVRAEALKPNRGPDGRPLPLAAHWHRRSTPLSWQIKQLRDGHHLLPWLAFTRRDRIERLNRQAGALRQLASWDLPLALITGGQWEQVFYTSDKWKKAPPGETGVAIAAEDGEPINAVSPFSPVEPWRELGGTWTKNAYAQRILELYPEPSRVLFVSNNEAHLAYKTEELKRYVDRYGTDRSASFRRNAIFDGWIERYRALIDGMRNGLNNEAWSDNSLFVAYNALGPDHFGRWNGWVKHHFHTKDRFSWTWHAWEGAIPDAYDNHWEAGKRAYRVWSMQTEMMNLVFMKRSALEENPNFWHEVIFWDGYRPGKDNDKRKQYREDGHEYTPELYRGWVQYVMWTLTPRVAREWRASAFNKENWLDYFNQVIKAVDVVHENPVLSRFWRHGELVPNEQQSHPFDSNLPDRWKNKQRWYHLNTNYDPEQWTLDAEVPVYTLARVIGEAGDREWLIYAHAPLGNREEVTVKIPSYRSITVDVPLEGAFFHVREEDGSIEQVRTGKQ